MKIKFLAVLSLAAIVFAAGCRGGGNNTAGNNTNAANASANTSTTVATPTPITKTNESAATDPNLKSKIEAALKAKGYTNLTVDTSTTPATLRGSYPKGKIGDVMVTATEANGGKPLKNEAQEK